MKTEIRICNSFYSRLMGLMFKKECKYGLIFKNCNAIHTSFMFIKIDVLFLDNNYRVIEVVNNLSSFKIKKNKYAKHTVEIPSNIKHNYKVGDIIHV